LNPLVLGNDGNEIRQIEKSPAATPAHRIWMVCASVPPNPW
jgi:hypothetical protein